MKAKIGDKIKLTSKFTGYHNGDNKIPFKEGDILEVTHVHINNVHASRVGESILNQQDYTCINESEFEVIIIDRTGHYPVSSQEEYNNLLEYLKGKGEPVSPGGYTVYSPWFWVKFKVIEDRWELSRDPEGIQIPLPEECRAKALPKSETLVLGIYKIGQVVVSLEEIGERKVNDLLTILPKSVASSLYYKESACSSRPESFRAATKEEIEFYEKGGQNIKDMTPTFKAGDYVVLLKGCTGGNSWSSSMPINHCYKLKKNYDKYNFFPEIDIEGSNENGWRGRPDFNSLMEVRAATQKESDYYKRYNIPFDINKIEEISVIKGRWYKLNNIWWGKADRFENGNFHMSESIDSKGKYYSSHGNAGVAFHHNSIVLMENLDEIQKYLPEGHVDKKVEYIKGVWYKGLSSHGKDKAKCDYVEGNKMWLTEWIDRNNNHHTNTGYLGISEHTKICPMEEVIPHLPTPKLEFKKGEYIVSLYNHNQFKRNYCFKQRENAKYLRPELDSVGSNNNGLASISINNPQTWRYATKEEQERYDDLGKPYDTTIPKSEPKAKPVVELKTGNWYKHKEGYGFIKFSSAGNNDIKYYTERITMDNKYDPVPSSVVWTTSNMVEAKPEEYERYLPKSTNIAGNFGLSVGMHLRESDLNNWCKKGENKYDPYSKSWEVCTVSFMGDRVIEKFTTINGVLGFKPSGTSSDVFLRAEGFLNFISKTTIMYWGIKVTEENRHFVRACLNKASSYNNLDCDGIGSYYGISKRSKKPDFGEACLFDVIVDEEELSARYGIPIQKTIPKSKLKEEAKVVDSWGIKLTSTNKWLLEKALKSNYHGWNFADSNIGAYYGIDKKGDYICGTGTSESYALLLSDEEVMKKFNITPSSAEPLLKLVMNPVPVVEAFSTLKVGDFLSSTNLDKWMEENKIYTTYDSKMKVWNRPTKFVGDRKVESIMEKDGVQYALISNTSSLYLIAQSELQHTSKNLLDTKVTKVPILQGEVKQPAKAYYF